MSNLRIGQKVVMIKGFPIDEAARAQRDGVTLPAVGRVYTVRSIDAGTGWDTGLSFIRLDELHNLPHWSDGIEPSWQSSFFRPAVERKTDISVFKAMLNTTPETVGAA